MNKKSFLLFLVIIGIRTVYSFDFYDKLEDHFSSISFHKFYEAGINILSRINCSLIVSLSLSECEQYLKTNTLWTSLNVFVPEITFESWNKFLVRHVEIQPKVQRYFPRSFLPQSNYESDNIHNYVYVFDPWAERSFGHFIAIFLIDSIDRIGNQNNCHLVLGGVTVDYYCVYMEVRPSCPNPSANVESRYSRVTCDSQFFPKISLIKKDLNNRNKEQEVAWKCVKLPVFGAKSCPTINGLRVKRSLQLYNTLNENNEKKSSTALKSSALFNNLEMSNNSCPKHQAILLFGGWRPNYPGKFSENIIKRDALLVRRKIIKMGIKPENVFSFVTDGQLRNSEDLVDIVPGTWQSASGAYSKQFFRQKIGESCSSSTCVENLIIYLKNVATVDGTMLLWDLDENSQANSEEYMTLGELVLLIKDCKTKRILVIADQNGGNELHKRLMYNSRHRLGTGLDHLTVITSTRIHRNRALGGQRAQLDFSIDSLLTEKFLQTNLDLQNLSYIDQAFTRSIGDFLVFHGSQISKELGTNRIKRFNRNLFGTSPINLKKRFTSRKSFSWLKRSSFG